MGKRFVYIALIVFMSFIMLGFGLAQTGFVTSQEQINQDYLETLRAQANLECLQNSHCSQGYECIDNSCINSEEINLYQKVRLSSNSKFLKVGRPINFAKRVLTKNNFPYLLASGEIDEMVDDELVRLLYSPAILIGENLVIKENENYFIKPNKDKPLFTYRFTFSKPVDFSNKNIQGQALRILGKEYIIGDDSSSSTIQLISEGKNIKLQDGKKIKTGFFSFADKTLVHLEKNKQEEILGFDIDFILKENKINVAENYVGEYFDNVKLEFEEIDAYELSEITFGGNC